ncbi:MAG TPA: acetyltransferase [Burkholderiales bacterium]|nr:acetyltransferase [Burkholderiales bacterium]
MQFYDIFNGDADGLCALQQLRLEEPRSSVLVTGVKRDIQLLARVHAEAGDELTVLDIALSRNAEDLARLLASGVRCRYFDHHAAGTIPRHPNLSTFIDASPDVCTSLLVDRYLSGRQRLWAVVAAFGDNLAEPALRAAASLELEEGDVLRLRELGEAINYNAYGETTGDLNYHPADLFETMRQFRDPREFIDSEPIFDVLRAACLDDLDRALRIRPEIATDRYTIVVLPDAAWSRRVHGIFGNRLATRNPERAHAVLVAKPGGYLVSVRAPVARPQGADALCARFDTGGGRAGAAGISFLPESELKTFFAEFEQRFSA